MNELAAQSFVVDAVCNAGGAAHKMSNRFLIGVADLSVKLPSRPCMFVEVKLEHIGRTTKPAHQFKLDVTVPQSKFLLKYQKAGMSVCVLSFVERGGLGRRGLSVAAFKLDKLILTRYVVAVCGHIEVPLSTAGENVLISILEEASCD